MFGLGYKWIFKSRWVALAFAAFVCWQAAELAAPADPQAAAAVPGDDPALATMKQAERNLDSLESSMP